MEATYFLGKQLPLIRVEHAKCGCYLIMEPFYGIKLNPAYHKGVEGPIMHYSF
jgi:hypothetical protein